MICKKIKKNVSDFEEKCKKACRGNNNKSGKEDRIVVSE